MHVKPVRYQNQRCVHFITFSCYHRMPLLDRLTAKEAFEQTLERVRVWYGCYITGYVVMPEHVHLLISEPERSRARANGCRAPGQSPPSRKKRGKGGAT
jgi:REP element-mobilizing transposase RayT